MKLEELKELWETGIKIKLKSGGVINGFFCSFERAEDDPTERDSITVETRQGNAICIYLDEIEQINTNQNVY